MIDATKITNFKATDYQLEEMILFWILASGKNGVTSAKCLNGFLNLWSLKLGDMSLSPFEIMQEVDEKGILSNELKTFGIGCNNVKSNYIRDLINSNINLRTCTVDDLEKIKGIGPKTARCFLIHSRKNQQYAGLDTHILKFLKDKGHSVPKATPTGKKYKELEQIFLSLVKESDKSVAQFDLDVWNEYRNK
jgi:thermostable 8-oxoguanine DNA glycosylase